MNPSLSGRCILESDLVHKPQGKGGGPLVAQVGEGVEESHVGSSHHGVTDLVMEGHPSHEHEVEADPMEDH